MIHLYCGDGKGKTSAAFGLALRAAGQGRPVVIAQFLKGGESGERQALAGHPKVCLIPSPRHVKFVFDMEEAERQAEAERQQALFQAAWRAVPEEGPCLLVLDELCAAISTRMLPLEMALARLERCRPEVEVVITGREPPCELMERADYVTEMRKLRHPYDRGIAARRGIEW